jgi:hypothetical protein
MVNKLDNNDQHALNASLQSYYGVGIDPYDPISEAKRSGMKEILFEDIDLMHQMGMRLDTFYVRLKSPNGELTATSATKVYRWINLGYEPLTELEG